MSDAGELIEAKREDRLDAEAVEWTPAPATLPPGYFPFIKSVTALCGLPDGFAGTADEFSELLGLAIGFPATRIQTHKDGRRKDVRDEVWKIVLAKGKQDEIGTDLVTKSEIPPRSD